MTTIQHPVTQTQWTLPAAVRTPLAPSLSDILDATGPLPPHSLVIGACDDGLHIFLDLTDPRPGSLLVAGDAGCGKTKLIRSILASVAMVNMPRQASFAVIAKDLGEYRSFSGSPNTLTMYPVYHDKAFELVASFTELTEQRRTGRMRGAAVVLAIDDLGSLWETMTSELRDCLAWLVQHGPESGVWPLAALDSRDIVEGKVPSNLLQRFGTRLAGHVADPGWQTYLTSGVALDPPIAGAQFYARFDGRWTPFWIPAER